MQRPGFLAGFESMTPRNAHLNGFGDTTGLGFFGKGAMLPPPGAPPAGSRKLLTHAINTQTKKFYTQDPRCAVEGEKMTKFDEPCTDPDCDPGERDIYEECADDPHYRELPPPPPTGFPDCNAWKAAGYPAADCNKQTCPSCFAPKQQRQQQQSQPQQQQAPDNSQEKAKLQAELIALEQQQAAVNQIPSGAPMMPMTPQYTGGGMPIMPQRRTLSPEEKREAQLEQLVSQHQTQRAMERSTSPTVVPTLAPPPPSTPAPAPPPPMEVQEDTGGIFSWLRSKLFGLDGYSSGFGEVGGGNLLKIAVPLAIILLIYKTWGPKHEPAV